MGMLLSWLAGSTYQISGEEALLSCTIAAVLLGVTPLLSRWLDILPLGAVAARAVGLNVAATRLAVMLVAALMTSAATLVVGPLTFVGLMAPHMARMMGAQRALHQVALAATIGALLMILADWAGRVIIFPFQMPAGLFATVIGGPYLMWLLRRQKA